MSHFTVLVIGEDVEKQLYPFWELDLDREQLRKDPRAEFEVEIPTGELRNRFKIWKVKEEEILNASDSNDAQVKWAKEALEKYKNSAKDWAEDYHGLEFVKGKGWGFWRNPQSKWDWHSIGGRWTGFFPLKPGAKGETGRPGLMTAPAKIGWADSVLKKDIDFDRMIQNNIEQAGKDWEKYLEEKTNDKAIGWLYGVKDRDTKESYVKRNTWWSTFAVLKDGKWYEKGKMGWWACVSDEKDSEHWDEEFGRLVEDLPDDTRLTLVDCHI